MEQLNALKTLLKKYKLKSLYLGPVNLSSQMYWLIRKAVYYVKLRKCIHQKRSLHKGERILVVLNRGGIGNIIETTPLIQAIRIHYPKSEIYLLTSYPDLFENWCIPDHILNSPEAIKNISFDYSFFAYWEWTSLPDWAKKFSLGTPLFPQKRNHPWPLRSEKNSYMELIERLGYKGPPPPLHVSIKPPETDLPIQKPYVCIVPGGKNDNRWRFKKWPYYKQLITMLKSNYPDFNICLIGTKEDHLELQHACQIIDLRGKLTLNETAWVLKNAVLAIGNDCGPMHLASAVNIPAIAIFGPTCIVKNTYSDQTTLIFPTDLKCWPCQHNKHHFSACSTGECIKSITPEKVMEQIKKTGPFA